VIDDHEFVMVADQIARGSRHRHTVGQKAHFEPTQGTLSTLTGAGVRDKRMNKDSTPRCALQGGLDLGPIEAEDHDLNDLLSLVDRIDQGRNSSARLYQ
jgi:hypothetical protein